MVLLAGCGQGAIGWFALGGACLVIAGCARRREEAPVEPIAMTAVEAEPAPALPAAAEPAPIAPPTPTEPATVAQPTPRPARPRVRVRPAARPPVSDEIAFERPMSRAAPFWHREPLVEPQVEPRVEPQVEQQKASVRPVAPAGIRSRAGGRWESER
jgi:hypothetical protein